MWKLRVMGERHVEVACNGRASCGSCVVEVIVVEVNVMGERQSVWEEDKHL